MGRTIIDAIDAASDMTCVGVVDAFARADSIALPSGGSAPLYTDASGAIEGCAPDVIIDFTNAAWTPVIADAALERRVRLIVGTTGLPHEWVEDLGRCCAEKKLGAVLAANFSLGAVLMMHFAKLAAPFFDAAEIIELHHDQKVDAPSGTSITTARGMMEARGGKPFARNVPDATPVEGTRAGAVDGITIHSVRLPGFVAHQEVIFGAQGQTLTIRHDSNRESYIPGILLAARDVMSRDELVVGLDTLIGLG